MNKNRVYLAQTDTTVGFLSSDDKKLSEIKQRSSSQKMLQVVDSFKTLKSKVRIPKSFRKFIRNAKNTTIIYPNSYSYRVVNSKSDHHDFIKKFKVMYSTSANITKNKFDNNYAVNNCDILIEDSQGYFESIPSNIFKINKRKVHQIR